MVAMSDLVAGVRNKSDFDSATVFLHKKRRVFLGGVPNARYGRMWCFSLEELKKFFGVAMCVSLTGLGDRVARMNGLPIGGLLSKVAASVVLSQEEREWSENDERRVSLGLPQNGTTVVITGMLQKVIWAEENCMESFFPLRRIFAFCARL